MRRITSAIHLISKGAPRANRLLALSLCAMILLGLLPASVFAEPNQSVIISGVDAPTPAEYTVVTGTELASVGLPTELNITVENEAYARAELVNWVGDYHKDAVGTYTLTAAFADDTLVFSPMPTVRITVAGSVAALQDPPAEDPISKGSRDMAVDGSTPVGNDDNIDYSAVCKLTPMRYSYAAGESIQFALSAQYATPGDPEKPRTVTFGIPIPETTPAVQLPMFYATGSGAYAGVPMYPLNYNGTTIDLYLKTGSTGNRWIEFTLDAGSTVQGTLSMILPNGISEEVPAFTLMPEILSPGDYGTNTLLEDGTTAIRAQFGWHDVNKTANTDNIGVIGAETKDPDRITYSVTANSKSSGIATGRIYTERYTLTDTITLSGVHYADGVLTQSEENGISTFSVDSVPVLEIAAPLSSLHVTKQTSGDKITAFDIEYTAYNTSLGNTDGSAAEMPNLNLSVTLLLAAMLLNPGTEDTGVTNTAKFDAYSLFGEHHESTASHTAHTQDRYLLTKAAFTDPACTQPAELIEDGDLVFYKITATNNSSGDGPFRITDVLPKGLVYVEDDCSISSSQSGQTLTWDGLTIPSGDSLTIVVKTQLEVADYSDLLTLHNVANLYNAERLLVSASADCTFLTGEINDADISYGKTVNKPYARMNEELTYTITVRNSNRSVPKLVTVVDKWPGQAVMPTAVTGCDKFVLLDAAGTEYTLEQVTADPGIIIAQIKCYNVYVPAGGNAKLTIKGKVTEVLDELVNIVGEGTEGAASIKSYGVRISKTPYAYDADAGALGSKLTASTPVNADDTVCYEMTITNYKDADINILQLIDKLPAGLSLKSVSFHGVTSSVVLKRDNAYSALSVTGDPGTNHQTTEHFRIDSGETVYVYLFATVSADAVAASINTSQRITNAAYVTFNSVQTGDATANIYTHANAERKVSVDKWFRFVADYDEELHYNGTWLQTPEGDDVQGSGSDTAATVWNGAYIGYQLQIKNATIVGGDNVDIYEIIDSLPTGTEFVGIAKDGSRHYFYPYPANNAKRDLTGELIFDGQTAAWTSGVHSSRVKCTYDRSVNQVRIQFVDAGNAPSSVSVVPSSDNAYKLFMLIVVRVKDDSEFSSYVNTAQIKVDNDVQVVNTGHNGVNTVDAFNYISASCTADTVPMAPGITKQYEGHFFLAGTAVPGTIETSPGISPGESLRFTVQVKNQGLDNNGNAVNASLQDFTVTDILPAEYTYRPGSATVECGAGYNTTSGLKTTDGAFVIARGSFEPAQEILSDGRTKLTWSFSGKDMRLMCNTKSSEAGFMHIITYDTDWNKSFLPRFGNYTNLASVNHGYSFTAVSTGTPDYTERSVAASAVVNVFGAAGTTAAKSVTNEAGDTASGSDANPYVSVAGVGAEVTYTLQVANATIAAQNSETRSLVIIDELPRAVKDTGVVNRVNRGAQFSVLFGENPAVSVYKLSNGIQTEVNSDLYTVRFGNSAGGLNSAGDWTGSDAGGRIAWGKASNGRNALRIALDPDVSLASGEMLLVQFRALAGADADPGEIAWNSFGYSYKSFADGALSEKIFAEPPRVGIAVPGATLSVTKRVTGDTAPSAARFTFLLKQNGAALAGVKYTLNGDVQEYRTGADGSFMLTAAQTATFYVAPGDGYSVEETALPDDFTLTDIAAAASGDGVYDESVFTFRTLADGDAVGAICTNQYTMPPTRDLTVSKIWAGQENPTPPTGIQVQLYQGGIAYGDPVTLDAGNSWRHTWPSLSTAENWTVDEVAAMPGYTKTVTGDSVNGFVITNSYAPTPVITAEVQAEKVIDGDPNPPDETFAFQLTAVSYTAPTDSSETMTADRMPMPFGSVDGTRTERITGAGRVTFGRFVFRQIGTYTYSLREDTGENTLYSYDGSVFNLIYTVVMDSEGRLAYTLSITKPGVSPNPSAVVFTNTYTQYVPAGELSVRKTVTGDLGDRDKDFTFKIVFDASGSYDFHGSKTGTVTSGDTVLLRHGETITITGLPAGTAYRVTESGNSGYRVTASGEEGVIAENQTAVAAFTNSLSSVPPTGEDGSLSAGLLLMLISLGCGTALLLAEQCLKRRRRRARSAR